MRRNDETITHRNREVGGAADARGGVTTPPGREVRPQRTNVRNSVNVRRRIGQQTEKPGSKRVRKRYVVRGVWIASGLASATGSKLL